MFDFIRSALGRIFKWVAGSDESKRADFAAVTDVSIELIETMQKTLTKSQERLDAVEGRLDHNKELREKAEERIVKLELGEAECQKKLQLVSNELSEIKKRIIE